MKSINIPKGCKVDFVSEKIWVTKECHNAAMKGVQAEFDGLAQLMEAFPNFRVSFRPVRKTTARKRLTIAKMIRHICRYDDSEKRLKEFNDMRYPKEREPSAYGTIRKWFLTKYPNYDKPVKFDEKGKIVGCLIPNTKGAISFKSVG